NVAAQDLQTSREWREISSSLRRVPSLSQIAEICDRALVHLAALRLQIEKQSAARQADALSELNALTKALEEAAEAARSVLSRLATIARDCQQIFDETDCKFLLDPERKVFTIGYNVSEGHHDNSFYDLLASEARLASFLAIAKGDVPQEHWFRMNRQFTSVDGGRALISWTATMFEYLMPLI